MPRAARTSNSSGQQNGGDFTAAQDYLNKDVYNADIEDIRGRLDTLEGRVKDHACLAASFKEAFEHDKDMDKVLVTLIVDLIQTNDDVKEAFRDAVEKTDRKWWNGAGKKALTAIGAVLLVALGALLQARLGK